MAADYIVVNRSKQLGNNLVNLADQLRQVRELCDKINDCGQHQFSGSDYSVLEAQMGLAAGQGQNTLTLVGLLNTILNANTDVLGATRLSQLDEFCARLAGQ